MIFSEIEEIGISNDKNVPSKKVIQLKNITNIEYLSAILLQYNYRNFGLFAIKTIKSVINLRYC